MWDVPTSAADSLLRGAGLRVTQPRLAVLRAVENSPHADTATVLGAVRSELESVSHQAVYDVLEALTADGARTPHPAGRLRRAL